MLLNSSNHSRHEPRRTGPDIDIDVRRALFRLLSGQINNAVKVVCSNNA